MSEREFDEGSAERAQENALRAQRAALGIETAARWSLAIAPCGGLSSAFALARKR